MPFSAKTGILAVLALFGEKGLKLRQLCTFRRKRRTRGPDDESRRRSRGGGSLPLGLPHQVSGEAAVNRQAVCVRVEKPYPPCLSIAALALLIRLLAVEEGDTARVKGRGGE